MTILSLAKDIARTSIGDYSKRNEVTWEEWTLEYRVYPKVEASFYEPGHSGIEGITLRRDGIAVDPSEYDDEWQEGLRRAVEEQR